MPNLKKEITQSSFLPWMISFSLSYSLGSLSNLMTLTPEGRFFVFMTNGEVFEVDRRTAGAIENYFEYQQ